MDFPLSHRGKILIVAGGCRAPKKQSIPRPDGLPHPMNASQNLLLGSMLVVSLVVVVAFLAVYIMFLLSLQKCLNRVAPANRAMEPGMVWLNLVPLLNLAWIFYTVIKLAESAVKEGQARGIDVADGGKTLGLVFAILGICGVIPVLGILCSIGALVCWILYWMKVSGISKSFAAQAVAPAAPVAPAV
jgi:hypothetical protein